MKTTGYIEDGYTRTAKLKAKGHNYPETTVVFRPLTSTERIRANAQLAIKKGDDPTEVSLVEAEELANQIVADHLEDWSIKSKEGQSLAITAEKLGRLDPFLSGAIYNLVWGNYDSLSGVSFPDEGKAVKNSK